MSEQLEVRSVEAVETVLARRWLGLAMGVLVLAGFFAVAVVVGRMPPFDRFVTDPLFFKRCLVGHVNMALIAWFYSLVAALLSLLPRRAPARWPARTGPTLGVAGTVLMILGAGLPESQPVLSNYVPTIDHAVFGAGQILFSLGILACVLDPGLLRDAGGKIGALEIPASARAGLRTAAVGLLLAALTFVVAFLNQPTGVDVEVYFELGMWGGGHVLQLVSTISMISVWLILLRAALGASPVSTGAARLLFLAMIVPWLISPLLALQGTWTGGYRNGFTQLMRWGLFPVTSIFLVLCVTALVRAVRSGELERRALAEPRISAFLVSAGLTLLGFGLGAAIRGSNTMVPAHYHASVGAVTVAFMAAAYLILGTVRLSLPGPWLRRAASWQPAIYGSGMAMFAAGFALAGAHGMGRKVYGAEQAGRSLAETIGLGVMGVGGFVAVVGGVIFLVVSAAVWWRGVASREELELTESSWRWKYGARKTG